MKYIEYFRFSCRFFMSSMILILILLPLSVVVMWGLQGLNENIGNQIDISEIKHFLTEGLNNHYFSKLNFLVCFHLYVYELRWCICWAFRCYFSKSELHRTSLGTVFLWSYFYFLIRGSLIYLFFNLLSIVSSPFFFLLFFLLPLFLLLNAMSPSLLQDHSSLQPSQGRRASILSSISQLGGSKVPPPSSIQHVISIFIFILLISKRKWSDFVRKETIEVSPSLCNARIFFHFSESISLTLFTSSSVFHFLYISGNAVSLNFRHFCFYFSLVLFFSSASDFFSTLCFDARLWEDTCVFCSSPVRFICTFILFLINSRC